MCRSGSEAGVRSARRNSHDGCWLLGYSPPLFAKPWMLAMRYDPNDKAGREEMRKGEGKL
jgi:hypothetical protein